MVVYLCYGKQLLLCSTARTIVFRKQSITFWPVKDFILSILSWIMHVYLCALLGYASGTEWCIIYACSLMGMQIYFWHYWEWLLRCRSLVDFLLLNYTSTDLFLISYHMFSAFQCLGHDKSCFEFCVIIDIRCQGLYTFEVMIIFLL